VSRLSGNSVTRELRLRGSCPFLLGVYPAVQVIDGVPDAPAQPDAWDLAGCGHPPQFARANRQGLGRLGGRQQ